MIYLIENSEIKDHWDFILLKIPIKRTAVILFKTKQNCGFISLKMLK